ncbi:MAG: HIT family protein [Clostridia bacterium]
MENCIYCTNIEKRDSLMIKVCELPYSEIFFLKDQCHAGRCVVCFKGHKKEYFELTPEENAGYFAEVAKVAKALYTIYSPDKINYLTMGDEMPHIHIHLVPKYRTLPSWNAALNLCEKAFLTDEENAQAVAKIKAEIEK